MQEIRAQFPKKVLPGIFKPHRYKVLEGGRGSAKSWTAARALLIEGTQRPLRVLCARETQKSIRDSVHTLLIDQMMRLGLAGEYIPHQIDIKGPNGTLFAFTGLSDLTAESIKSFEGFDIVWIEEARVVTDRSWTILIPTIRKEGSEIWITFNPELDTDPVWKRFIESPPPDTWHVTLNWRDNPWFSSVLEQERQHAERTLPKIDYENIWEGKCRPAISGAIYAEEIAEVKAQRRICSIPYDPYHLVYIVCDIGWNDSMSVGFWQRHLAEMRCIDFMEFDHRTWDWFTKEARSKPYAYGNIFLPHDGGHATVRSAGKSDKDVLEGLGWRVTVLDKRDVEAGIRETRATLKTMAFDDTKCKALIEHIRRYRRSIPSTTGEPGAPVHDEHSHTADMVRYAAQAGPQMDDEQGMNLPDLKYPKDKPI